MRGEHVLPLRSVRAGGAAEPCPTARRLARRAPSEDGTLARMEQFAEARVSGHTRSSCSTVQAAFLLEEYRVPVEAYRS